MYKIAAILGEAGSGKDTIMNRVLLHAPNTFRGIVNHTTRPMREGEAEGREYYFTTEQKIINKIFNGEMLEVHANHWLYGTSFNELSEEKINIGVFTPYVIENFLKNNDKIELQVFRIEVNEKERMLRQLNRETNPDVKEIVRRFGTDLEDFANLNFDYKVIKNDEFDDIEEAVDEIIAAFGQNQLNDKA